MLASSTVNLLCLLPGSEQMTFTLFGSLVYLAFMVPSTQRLGYRLAPTFLAGHALQFLSP